MRSDKRLKSVERWIEKHSHLIDEHWIERDEYDYESPYSYWIYLAPGFINPLTETHCVHEATARDCLDHLKSIQRCFCSDCLDQLRKAREKRQAIYNA